MVQQENHDAIRVREETGLAHADLIAEADAALARAQAQLADRTLYEQYAAASAEAPALAPATPRLMPEPSDVEAEVMRRADDRVAKSAGRLSVADAITETFHDDPDLYLKYVHGDDDGEPETPTEPPPTRKTAAPDAPTMSTAMAHVLGDDLLRLAKLFRPGDPTGEGLLKVKQALGLLHETIERKKRSAA